MLSEGVWSTFSLIDPTDFFCTVSGSNCIFHVLSLWGSTSCFAPTSPFIFLSWGWRETWPPCVIFRDTQVHTQQQSVSHHLWTESVAGVKMKSVFAALGWFSHLAAETARTWLQKRIDPRGCFHNACICRNVILGAVWLCIALRVWAGRDRAVSSHQALMEVFFCWLDLMNAFLTSFIHTIEKGT